MYKIGMMVETTDGKRGTIMQITEMAHTTEYVLVPSTPLVGVRYLYVAANKIKGRV